MIFVFVVMLSGLLTLFRTLNSFVRERFLARDRQIFLLLSIFAVQFVTCRSFSNSYFGFWMLALFPIFASKLSFKVLIFIREKQFKETFGTVIDEIIIEMRSGQSFRSGLNRANERSNPFVQQKVRKIIELVRFNATSKDIKEPFIEYIVGEFRKIDENSHNSLQRVLTLRHRIRTEADYRRRSGQATLQIRLQAGILAILYFATALFVIANSSVAAIKVELLISFSLFFVGTMAVFLFGRSYKWKV